MKTKTNMHMSKLEVLNMFCLKNKIDLVKSKIILLMTAVVS